MGKTLRPTDETLTFNIEKDKRRDECDEKEIDLDEVLRRGRMARERKLARYAAVVAIAEEVTKSLGREVFVTESRKHGVHIQYWVDSYQRNRLDAIGDIVNGVRVAWTIPTLTSAVKNAEGVKV
jgi:hypothetical protein